jgi:hypothetical protein
MSAVEVELDSQSQILYPDIKIMNPLLQGLHVYTILRAVKDLADEGCFISDKPAIFNFGISRIIVSAGRRNQPT